jgi:hypothetical protein
MQSDSSMRIGRTLETQDGISLRWQLIAFILALIAIFTRLPGALIHPQFFAEDGWVWFQQAYNLHWWPTLRIAQAGYLQTFPRLVAGLTLGFPLQWAPLIMNLAGAVVQALPVTALLARRSATWGPLPLRILMAALYLAIPDAPEIHIVLTNAMWHLAVLQALLAFSLPPLTWRGRIVDNLVFAIGCVSGPFCILLLPSVVLYWWLHRQRWTLVAIVWMALGVVIQVLSILHTVRAPGAPLGVTTVRLLRIIAGSLFIDSMIGSGGPSLPIALLLLAAIAGFAIMGWACLGAPLALRLYILFAVLALMASLRDPLLLPSATPRWEILAHAPGIRYWFLPSLMFLWSAAWCALHGKTPLVRYAGWSVVLLLMIGIVRKWEYPSWPQSHFRSDVAHFNTLRSGEHMTFSVYDPGGRTMELVKH